MDVKLYTVQYQRDFVKVEVRYFIYLFGCRDLVPLIFAQIDIICQQFAATLLQEKQ